VTYSHDEWNVQLVMDVVMDMAKLGQDPFVGPAFERAAEINSNEFAQDSGVDPLEIVLRDGRHYNWLVS
jgi:hypothetical protein